MRPDANPLHDPGERNLFCPYYSGCLDHACNHFWQFWSCIRCVHQHTAEQVHAGGMVSMDGYESHVVQSLAFGRDRIELFKD